MVDQRFQLDAFLQSFNINSDVRHFVLNERISDVTSIVNLAAAQSLGARLELLRGFGGKDVLRDGVIYAAPLHFLQILKLSQCCQKKPKTRDL